MKSSIASFMKYLMTVASIGVLLMMFSGCSILQKQEPEVQIQTVILTPPIPATLFPRMLPELTGETYRDITDFALRSRESNLACEADKRTAAETLQ